MTIAAGHFHSAFIDSEGHPWTFGYGYHGRLGHPGDENRLVPTKIESDETFTAVAAGKFQTLLLSTKGEVWICGDLVRNEEGGFAPCYKIKKIPLKIKITAFSLTDSHSVLLDENGGVWTFGYGTSGQLGHNSERDSFIPRKINSDTVFIKVAAGSLHTVLLAKNGEAWSCGYSIDKRTGYEGFYQLSLKKIESPVRFKDIAAGKSHTLFIDIDGSPWSCGTNISGQLGRDDVSGDCLQKIKTDLYFVALSAGDQGSALISKNGEVVTFGNGRVNALGHHEKKIYEIPQKIISKSVFIYISLGLFHTLLVDSEGKLWSAGSGYEGRLGHGSQKDEIVFKQIAAIPLVKILRKWSPENHQFFSKEFHETAVCILTVFKLIKNKKLYRGLFPFNSIPKPLQLYIIGMVIN